MEVVVFRLIWDLFKFLYEILKFEVFDDELCVFMFVVFLVVIMLCYLEVKLNLFFGELYFFGVKL